VFLHWNVLLSTPRTKNPHQDEQVHLSEGLVLALNSYTVPQLKRLPVRELKMLHCGTLCFISKRQGIVKVIFIKAENITHLEETVSGKHNFLPILYFVEAIL
jgi:hypothetical protein